MQQVIGEIDGRYERLELPDPEAHLLDSVRWGSFEHALTPAFWVSQAWMAGVNVSRDFCLGTSLTEEVTICLLGGHGAPAEVGVVAAQRILGEIRNTASGLLSQDELEKLLLAPMVVRGRPVCYRFAAQRAKYLAASLRELACIDETVLGDIELREALRRLPGIGPKTASWIVRNRRGSDNVAILDVHIVRACEIMTVFPRHSDPARKYFELEQRFLDFCLASGARASVMDAVMWATMRKISKSLLRRLDHSVFPDELDLPLFQEKIA